MMITSALFLLIIRDIRYALQTIWLNYKHFIVYTKICFSLDFLIAKTLKKSFLLTY